MSVFTRKDPRLLACADPTWPAALWRMLRRHAYVASAILLAFALWYAGNVVAGLRAAAQVRGTMNGLAVHGQVEILRDARGIPHIRARNLHDLYFAQGFAQASDRLFEMDLTRRYAYGRLAEVFGVKALDLDERMRAVDIAGIARREWQGSGAATRAALQAFSDGVNAAELRQPLPVEFRMVLYRPRPWTPRDSIAVSVVAALELGDSWYDVLARDDRWRALGKRCYDRQLPLSDPAYDVTIQGGMLGRKTLAAAAPQCAVAQVRSRTRIGSNAWAAGSLLTRDHHALIANDPHVDLTIPGIWYVMDLQAPGLHVAGAVIPGLPGIALGHNERVAWAVTNAEVATSVLYQAPSHLRGKPVLERFGVRFGSPVTKFYYRTKDAFAIEAGEDGTPYLVRWPSYQQHRTSISTLLALDRADSIEDAARALSGYHGAPQNFIIADTRGRIAYHLAGAIPDDAAWGRYVHPASDLRTPLRLVPFADLPSRAPSRSTVLLTANNKMYGPGYPYRLSAAFEPPYRAFRIAAQLRARQRYDAAYFERMQMDTCSPIDAEIAHRLARIARDGEARGSARRAALAAWNGCFQPGSRAASLEHDIRENLIEQTGSLAALLAQLRDPHAAPGLEQTIQAALWPFADRSPPWNRAGKVEVEHPLSPTWYGLLQGMSFPGDGDEYSVHLQEPGFAQGFRAVWDAGNWDAGGIVLPSGESGEPGSGHYDDLAKAWIRGEMVPLPFSREAVARNTVSALRLLPR